MRADRAGAICSAAVLISRPRCPKLWSPLQRHGRGQTVKLRKTNWLCYEPDVGRPARVLRFYHFETLFEILLTVMKARVFFHNNCFDGACSAAVFSRFYRAKIQSQAEFQYTGLAHKASRLFDETQFDGDENAIVDFKYTPSPRLNWWFDHHQSAFQTPEDLAHFQQDKTGKKFF